MLYANSIQFPITSASFAECARPKERVKAGRHFAVKGDTRGEVMTLEKMTFCFIPSGPFIMGEAEIQHTNHKLDKPYWMSRFPVTQAQFTQFVDAGGYDNAEYWPEAERMDFWSEGRIVWARNSRSQPEQFLEPFNFENHPVVGVSWYEALAFTRWLTADSSLIAPGWIVKLPSEAQWEKAARGGLQVLYRPLMQDLLNTRISLDIDPRGANPEPKRLYPWGNDADSDLANYEETGIATTSAVGCFPGGQSPYGCEEMSGNVWEWTCSLWEREENQKYAYPYDPEDGRERLDVLKEMHRVVRGGDYTSFFTDLRCGERFSFNPGYRRTNVGFRLVLEERS